MSVECLPTSPAPHKAATKTNALYCSGENMVCRLPFPLPFGLPASMLGATPSANLAGMSSPTILADMRARSSPESVFVGLYRSTKACPFLSQQENKKKGGNGAAPCAGGGI